MFIGEIMASKKYVNDYKIDLEYNPLTKRQKMTAHYIGPRFSFTCGEKIGRTKLIITGMAAAAEISFILMLLLNAPLGHVWYTAFPLVLLMIPMFTLLTFLYRFLTAKENVTREHRDKITDRFRFTLAAGMILAGLELIGHVFYSIFRGDEGTDIYYYLFTAVILFLFVFLFRIRHRIDMTMTEEGQGGAEDNKNLKEEETK